MSTIRTGPASRELDHATDEWIEHEIKHLHESHQPVCVQVTLKTSSIDMILSTPHCAATGGGGRAPNARETEIFREWDERGLNRTGWHVHGLIHFLKRIKHRFK